MLAKTAVTLYLVVFEESDIAKYFLKSDFSVHS